MATKLQLFDAGTPELVRSNQKDLHYNGYLTALLSDMTEPFLPRRYWLIWHRELQLIAELVYYSMTTLKGNQTLGEEYCNMVQVTNGQIIPSLIRRLLSTGLHVIGRYALEKGLGFIKRRFARTNTHVSRLMGQLEEILTVANQTHLALFYLFGVYQWLSKRLTGIRYLMIHYDHWQPTANPYRLLGVLILIQLVIKLGRWLKESLLSSNTTSSYTQTLNEGVIYQPIDTLKCSLCLEGCVCPTVPPCGHLYCWNCIIDWVSDKNQCPVCRSPVQPRQLVPLQHFQLQ